MSSQAFGSLSPPAVPSRLGLLQSRAGRFLKNVGSQPLRKVDHSAIHSLEQGRRKRHRLHQLMASCQYSIKALLCLLFCHFLVPSTPTTASTSKAALIMAYSVGYTLVGTILFCNFLPWT